MSTRHRPQQQRPNVQAGRAPALSGGTKAKAGQDQVTVQSSAQVVDQLVESFVSSILILRLDRSGCWQQAGGWLI